MFSSQNSQVSNDVNYIEDVFSTYLYDGNSSSQVINNGINLAGKGGLVWMKNRGSVVNHGLMDTARGTSSLLCSNLTDAEKPYVDITSFNSNGFTLGFYSGWFNSSGGSYVSWTFRKQPKFFDVVTYTGNNAAQTIPHNLGSTPGCVIIKCTNVAGTSWWVRHRSVPGNAALLNSSSGFAFNINDMPAVSSTALSFSSGTSTNNSGETYVAYIFAHDAGGFGLTGTDNVISCGSFTTDGTGAAGNITLGYESQLVMFKRSDGVGNWQIVDTMRGSSLTSYNYISPTVSNAESSSTSTQGIYPTATGFYVGNNFPGANQTYVYMAIRRPMKVPTTGTSVFAPIAANNAQGTENTTGFPLDMQILNIRGGYGNNGVTTTRLIGVSSNTTSSGTYLRTPSTAAELSNNPSTQYWSNTGFQTASEWASSGMIYWSFRRAPGFFDVVCYTGTGVARTVAHNLGVVPELMIVKIRSSSDFWVVYSASTGAGYYLGLNYSDPKNPNTQMWDNTTPTSSVFSLNNSSTNNSGSTFVAYLFATCLGVSKVGSYTGNGSSQTIACGFTTGARFVMIKRTDASGDWYVWDTARGIVSGNDPHLSLNTTAAEVTTDDTIDPDNSGFIVNQVAATNVNVSSATYIFLAIA